MATACLDLRKKLRINKLRRQPVHRTGQLQSDTGARLAKLRNPPGLTAWKVLLAICFLHEWLHKTATTLSKKSELAKAIRYALSNWVALTRYCEDGRLEIDNNAAERA